MGIQRHLATSLSALDLLVLSSGMDLLSIAGQTPCKVDGSAMTMAELSRGRVRLDLLRVVCLVVSE